MYSRADSTNWSEVFMASFHLFIWRRAAKSQGNKQYYILVHGSQQLNNYAPIRDNTSLYTRLFLTYSS